MKTYRTKLKSKFFLLLLLSFPIWAKPVAQISDLKGQVFVINKEGKTTLLKPKDLIEDKAEVMVEEGGSITVTDYFDATYHLIGGSHMKFFDRSVQLKRGKAWIQSLNDRHSLVLTTSNANVDFSKSEFVATFDQANSRSQFLVVNGDLEVSNVLEKNMKSQVDAGYFTMVDPDVEDGIPRAPTKVGLESLNLALSEFKSLPQKTLSGPSRNIASEAKTEVKKGEIIFIKTTEIAAVTPKRIPASATKGSAHAYFKKKAVPVSRGTPVPIRFYGLGKKVSMEAGPRTPASIPPASGIIQEKKVINEIKNDPEFGESLKTMEAQQPKYSNELNSLIDDLKSY